MSELTTQELPWEQEWVIVSLFDLNGRSRQENHETLTDFYKHHVENPQLYQEISMIVITSKTFHDSLEDVRQAQNPQINENKHI